MGLRSFSRAWAVSAQSAALALFSASSVAARAVDPDLELLPSSWDRSASFKTSLGYRDNVALSHAAPEGSGFFRGTVEAVAVRLPLDGPQLTFLLTGEDTRYFSSKNPDHEDLLIATAEIKHLGAVWESSLGLEGTYLNQVLDISITETNRQPLPLQAGSVIARPGLRRNLPEQMWLTLELPASRQWYADSVDDSWDIGPRVTLGSTSANKSESSLGYAFTWRSYDTEPTRTETGDAIAGTHRLGWQHEMLWTWRHYWDADRRWRTTTKINFRSFTGNGSSYFDYLRMGISEQLRFRHAKWELSTEVRFALYQFATQTVSPGDLSPRERTDLTFNVRGERELARHWRVFAQYDREQTFSNLTLDEYRVNTVSGGVALEF